MLSVQGEIAMPSPYPGLLPLVVLALSALMPEQPAFAASAQTVSDPVATTAFPDIPAASSTQRRPVGTRPARCEGKRLAEEPAPPRRTHRETEPCASYAQRHLPAATQRPLPSLADLRYAVLRQPVARV